MLVSLVTLVSLVATLRVAGVDHLLQSYFGLTGKPRHCVQYSFNLKQQNIDLD